MSKPGPDIVVSVVITVYNPNSLYLKQALQSVLKQTYKNIEVIVVDDGSDVISSNAIDVELGSSNIIYLSLGKNCGVGAARNYGVNHSSGHYIAFLDYDDWWHEVKLEKQLKQINEKNVEWSYCGRAKILNGKIVNEEKVLLDGYIYDSVLKEQIILGSASSVMVSRQAFDMVGGFAESREIIEDWDLWIKLAKHYPVASINECLVYIRSGNRESRSSNVQARLERLKGLVNAHNDEYRQLGLLDYVNYRFFRVKAILYQDANNFPESALAMFILLFNKPSLLSFKRLINLFIITLPLWILDRFKKNK